MDPFRFPTIEGAQEVARHLGISVEEITGHSQDWEHTFPRLADLLTYERIYARAETSLLAKCVLGSFIFACLEEHLRANGPDDDHYTTHLRRTAGASCRSSGKLAPNSALLYSTAS